MFHSQTLTQCIDQIDNVDTKVHKLVKYLLVADHSKMPIKKTDIIKNAIPDHAKYYTAFLERAKQVLNEVYGYDIVEVEPKAKAVILTNCLDTGRPGGSDTDFPLSFNFISDAAAEKSAFTMIVLSLLFMNNLVKDHVSLHADLLKFDIDVNKEHKVFGDVKKLLKTLQKQGYLECNKQPNTDPVIYDYSWGKRAHCELLKGDCLQFVCKILGAKAESFPHQYQAVQDEEARLSGAAQDE